MVFKWFFNGILMVFFNGFLMVRNLVLYVPWGCRHLLVRVFCLRCLILMKENADGRRTQNERKNGTGAK